MAKAFFKNCIATVLALLLLAAMVPAAVAATPSEDTFGTLIHTFQEEFPVGKYWNDANGTVKSGRYQGTSLVGDRSCVGYGCGSLAVDGSEWAWQCHGYAMLLADRVFGSFYNIDSVNWSKTDYTRGSFSGELYAGDVVRVILPRGSAHSVFVYKVTEDTVYYTECNRHGKCQLDWDSEELQSFKKRVTYIHHYKGNTLKGTKTVTPQLAITYHANGGQVRGADQAEERYRVLTEAGMNLREKPSLSASTVKNLPKGTEFAVSQTEQADGYLWGKTEGGWCAISNTAWVEKFSVPATKYYVNDDGILCKSESGAVYQQKCYMGISYPNGLVDASTFKLEKEGFLFVGWSTKPQGATVWGEKQAFQPEELVPALASGDQKITVYAIWKDLKSEVPFLDVLPTQWFYEGVLYTNQKGLMNGISETEFAPDSDTTRAMLVTVLHRMEGSPAPQKQGAFSDIEAGTWYTDAVAWAAENNVVNGMGDGTFAPDDKITREQLTTVLFRYGQFKQKDEGTRAPLEPFADQAKVSQWASEGMQWAVSKGIINGINEEDKTNLQPQGNATRAQIATVLMRYDKEILK
ncbi:MAG: S-layer homology domain-containing protein [Clostridia bacterium]|nr:S-layer homology domain-containing protein [Clostridia bacterium]